MSGLKDMNDKVYKIIGACIEVHKTLGPGYPVEFYQKALDIELASRELDYSARNRVEVQYKDTPIGEVTFDFIIEKKALLSIRCQDTLYDHEMQQVLRGLSLIDCEVGVLVNFGQAKIQYKRIIPGRMQHSNRNQPAYLRGGNTPHSKGRTRENNPII
ncbi:GxxExxY protein [bacterium]|nr:GxxExxY protein [bacterium]